MKKLNYLLLSSVLIIMLGCRSADPCPDRPSLGNLGSIVNTRNDDYLPSIDNNYLYFTSLDPDEKKSERMFKSKIVQGKFTVPVIENELPLIKYEDCGSPVFYYNTKTGEKELYFAAVSESKMKNRDIFISKFKNGIWSEPTIVENISTENYEAQPAISSDGNTMVFVSDRPGGFGETDLYVSYRQSNGKWSAAENLGPVVNTKSEELSPYISNDDNLYYASKGFRKKTGYDIIKASTDGKGNWNNAKLMPSPFNSEKDETGPTIWQDKLILASNRTGGCGAFDIYAFDICKPSVLNVYVQSSNPSIMPDGKFELYENTGEKIGDYKIDNTGYLKLDINPSKTYLYRYKNGCFTNINYEQRFTVPCSDSTVNKLIIKLTLPDNTEDFSIEKYDLPFFVSGYYKPNTSENLEELKLKFSYNLFGNSDSTKYIENPGSNYNQYTKSIETALGDAIEYILSRIDDVNNPCLTANSKILISVSGYADPRPISSSARFPGADIDDHLMDIVVDQGEVMTNELLSALRAYFTAKYIQMQLEMSDKYRLYRDKIIWEVEGKGVSEIEGVGNEKKRRVDLKIQLIDEDNSKGR